MEALLNPAIPDETYVTLLEQPVSVLYTAPNPTERNRAQELLTKLQDLPNAWMRVDKVLDFPSSSVNAKFFALQTSKTSLFGTVGKRYRVRPVKASAIMS